MSESQAHRSISIKESAVGSAIVSGDGNTIYVIQQTLEQRQEESASASLAAMGPNPYKGLAAFQERDAARYFGREAQIKRLWQRFQDLYEQSAAPRFLPILGPSGCGKSSLVRAGLIPELARRPLPGKENLRVAVLVPGSRPLEALAGVLAKAATQDPLPVEKAEEFERVLQKPNDAGEYEGLRRIAVQIPGIHETPLVVLVDQFEEVYSLCKDLQQRRAFIGTLLHAASDPTGNVSVIVTLRSDFWGETQRHERLNQIIGSDWSLNVPAMTAEELHRAIAAPAEQAGHPLDNATIALLVKDTEGREGALPLLQFALMRIWEGLNEGKAPAETYQEMGGVGGALAGKAQELYDKLSPPDREIARRVFVGLVQLGEGTRDTRRRVKVENLRASQDVPDAVKQVIQRFSSPGARLVSLASQEGEETAEVTHEALFDHWQLLNDWLNTSRDDIRFQRRLEVAAEYWDKQGRPPGLLWRSPDLDLLRQFEQKVGTDMNPTAVAFFKAADAAEKRERQQKAQAERLRRWTFRGVVAGLLFMTTLSSFAGYKVHQAERRRMSLYEAIARERANTNPLESLVHGLAAIGLSRSTFVRLPNLRTNSLMSTAVLDKPNRTIKARHVTALLTSIQNTSRILSIDSQKLFINTSWTIEILDWQGNPIGEPFAEHFSYPIRSAALSPDEQLVATGDEKGILRLWDLQGNLVKEILEAHQSWIHSVAFSPNGQIIVTGDGEGIVRLWNLEGILIDEIPEAHQPPYVFSIAFNPDGQIFATGGGDKTVRLWNLKGDLIGQPLRGHSSWVRSVAFSPDGQVIATSDDHGVVRLWDLQGNLISTLSHERQTSTVYDVAFSPDGLTIISGGTDGIHIWDREGNFKDTLSEDAVYSVAFSPDGQTIIGLSHQAISFWDAQGDRLFEEPFENDWIDSVAFSPNGQIIAGGSYDGSVHVWDSQGNRIGEPLTGSPYGLSTVEFTPDGKTIVSASSGGIYLWDSQGQRLGGAVGNYTDEVLAVALNPVGTLIASGNGDYKVRLWDLQGNLIGKPFEGHSSVVYAVDFSPDGQTIASVSQDKTLRLWDLEGNPIKKPFEASIDLRSVAFSPDGQTIVSGGENTILLWNLQGELIAEPFEGHTSYVTSVAFSPDGQTILSTSEDKTIRLWDLQGNLIGEPLEGHDSRVNSASFSPDGQTIVSGSAGGTVRLWPVWLIERGWISVTCDRLKSYLLVHSETDEVARAARRTCDRYAWK